jgi:hypothetical protein
VIKLVLRIGGDVNVKAEHAWAKYGSRLPLLRSRDGGKSGAYKPPLTHLMSYR